MYRCTFGACNVFWVGPLHSTVQSACTDSSHPCLRSTVRPAPAAARPAGAMSAPGPAKPTVPAITAVDRKYQAFLAEMSELGAV